MAVSFPAEVVSLPPASLLLLLLCLFSHRYGSVFCSLWDTLKSICLLRSACQFLPCPWYPLIVLQKSPTGQASLGRVKHRPGTLPLSSTFHGKTTFSRAQPPHRVQRSSSALRGFRYNVTSDIILWLPFYRWRQALEAVWG